MKLHSPYNQLSIRIIDSSLYGEYLHGYVRIVGKREAMEQFRLKDLPQAATNCYGVPLVPVRKFFIWCAPDSYLVRTIPHR